MPRYPRLTLPLLATLSLSLTACGGAQTSSPAVVNACNSITLPPRLNDADRAKLADEIDASPGAVWVSVLTGEARVNRDIVACQGVRP